MGKVVKKVGSLVGLGGSATAKTQSVGQSYYDISKEVAPAQEDYKKLLESGRATQTAVSPMQQSVLTQMGQAAMGQGPSLAEAQLKQAQDRTLAQQLAAVQSGRGGNAAMSQRNLMQAQSGAGRDLAQQAVIERLKERSNFMTQAGLQGEQFRRDIGEGLDLSLKPKDRMLAYETQRVESANANAKAKAEANAKKRGMLFSAAGSIMGGPIGGMIGNSIGGMLSGGGASAGIPDKPYHGEGGMAGRWKDGGLVTKKDMPKYKDGGFVEGLENLMAEARRSKYAGSAANATQAELDKRKGKTSKEKTAADSVAEKAKQQRYVQGYEDGGEVDGPGTPTSDSIPALLSDGEFVVKAKVVSKPGIAEFLDKLNSESKLSKKDLSNLAKALQARKSKK